MSPGMFSRPSTMVIAGMVLSQPEIVTRPSNMWLRATSSTESATTSRLMSEPFIPSVPMVMPSVMEIVLTSIGVPAAARSVPSRRTRLLRRGSLAMSELLCRMNEVRAILQQVAQRSQRIALRRQHADHRRQRLDEAHARAGHAVGVVEVENSPRPYPMARALDLQRRARWAASFRLRRPEHARCPEPAEHGEEREVGHAPRRPEEPRRRSGCLGDGVMPLPHLAPGLPRPREPEAPVAPRVVAEIVARGGDAPDARASPRRPLADQEEGRRGVVGGQDVEHARGLLGIGPVVEGEADLAPRPRSTPDAPQRQEM